MSISDLIDENDMPMSGAISLVVALDDRWTAEERYQAVMLFIAMICLTAADGNIRAARKSLDEFSKAAKRLIPDMAASYAEAAELAAFMHRSTSKQ